MNNSENDEFYQKNSKWFDVFIRILVNIFTCCRLYSSRSKEILVACSGHGTKPKQYIW